MQLQKISVAVLIAMLSPCLTPSASAQQSVLANGDPASSQLSSTVLELDQVIDRVLRENPSMLAIRQDEAAASALALQASLRPNPSLSYDHQRIPRLNNAYSAGLSIPVEVFGQRGARMNAADFATRAARADIRKAETDLRGLAIQAFLDVVSAQDRLELARAAQALADRSTDVAQRRVQAGRASPVEEQRARITQGTTRVELSQAMVQLQAARALLSSLWGQSQPTAFSVSLPSAEIAPGPAKENLEQQIQASPILARARAEVDHRQSLIRLARAEAAPETAINLGTGTLIETGQRANSIGLSISIPIFNRNQGNIQEAQVRLNQASQQLVAAETGLRTEVGQAMVRLNAARQQTDLAKREIIPEATRTLDASTRGYELGRFSLLEVLDSQRALFTARAQLLVALSDAYKASSDLERLLGPGNVDSVIPKRVQQ